MARSTVKGSISSRKVIALRPDDAMVRILQGYAEQWRCSLSDAALRLIGAGLTNVDAAEPSERVQRVGGWLRDGVTAEDVVRRCSTDWGLTRTQALQLMEQAKA